MYYFEFSFTATLGFEIDFDPTLCRRGLELWHKIAETYDLSIVDSESFVFDCETQQKLVCIDVVLSRQVKRLQTAHNLIKICEASLQIFSFDGLIKFDYKIDIV